MTRSDLVRLGRLSILGIATLACGGAIAQTSSRAALVRDVDRPESQPVSGYCTSFLQSGSAKCTLYTVPAGKRLVVETVSYSANVEAAKQVYQVLFGQGDAFVIFSNALFSQNIFLLQPALAYTDGTSKSYSNTTPLKMYLDAGSILIGGVGSTGTVSYSQQFGFSGFLVDK